MLRPAWTSLLFPLLLALLAPPAGAAVFTVTKASDGNDGVCNADCSLREAVLSANAVPGSTVIVPAGHYRLSLPPPDRIMNNPGDGSGGNLVVTAPMTIQGAGRDVTILDARPSEQELQGIDRVLAVTSSGDLTLSGVTITGGALLSQFDNGGGLKVSGGRLRIADSAIVQNSTNGAGGGMEIHDSGQNPAVVEITRTEILDNFARGPGGGIWTANGTVTVTDSTIAWNRSVTGGGGGIMNANSGTRQITPMALLRVRRSTIADNVSGNPLIDPLAGGVGGGIYNSSGRLEVENSTITRNEVRDIVLDPVGPMPAGRGGGIASWAQLGDEVEDTAVVVNSTIAWNRGAYGSQLHMQTQNDNLFELANTVIAGDGSDPNCAVQNAASGFHSHGGNVSSDASPCGLAWPADQANVGPGVATALADHGGPTETLALLDGSPALGFGVPDWCPQRDQRGAWRRVPCDSGAVEAVAVPEAGAAAGGAAAAGALALLRARRRRA